MMDESKQKNEHKRNPALAAIASLLFPGLGHLYAGDAVKALLLLGVQLAGLLLAGGLGVVSTLYGFYAVVVFLLGLLLYAAISAGMLASRNREYTLKRYNRWYVYLGWAVVVSVTMNLMLENRGLVLGYESYRIPATSMEPTLQPGDFILVDARYSGPEVGDLVVFRYPLDRRVSYVKRVAGLGGDRIAIRDGVVLRNGQAVDALNVAAQRRESQVSREMAEITIPKGQIFVLGDWRDRSADSRYWGMVPMDDVLGKVTSIWFSSDMSRIGPVE